MPWLLVLASRSLLSLFPAPAGGYLFVAFVNVAMAVFFTNLALLLPADCPPGGLPWPRVAGERD